MVSKTDWTSEELRTTSKAIFAFSFAREAWVALQKAYLDIQAAGTSWLGVSVVS